METETSTTPKFNRFPFAVNLPEIQPVKRLASRRPRLFLENLSKFRRADSASPNVAWREVDG
jgi:hypothetical protein